MSTARTQAALDTPTTARPERSYPVLAAIGGKMPPLPTVKDHTFEGSSGPLTMRLYRPAQGLLPVMLFLHSGGFANGSLGAYDSVLQTVAAKTGWVVAATDYRSPASTHAFATAAEDCYNRLGDPHLPGIVAPDRSPANRRRRRGASGR